MIVFTYAIELPLDIDPEFANEYDGWRQVGADKQQAFRLAIESTGGIH